MAGGRRGIEGLERGTGSKPSILYRTSFDRDDPEYPKQVEEFYPQALTALRRLTAPEEWLWMVTGYHNYFDDYADEDYCVWRFWPHTAELEASWPLKMPGSALAPWDPEYWYYAPADFSWRMRISPRQLHLYGGSLIRAFPQHQPPSLYSTVEGIDGVPIADN